MNAGGTMAASSRERILARVAQATASRARLPHPGALVTPRAADAAAAFVKRFTSSGGEVAEADPGRPASEWLTGFLRGLDPEVVGVAVGADVPAEQRPELPEVAAAHAGAGISVAWGAVAESGSLILPSTGTRAAQLLPAGSCGVGAGRAGVCSAGGRVGGVAAGVASGGGVAFGAQQVSRHRAHGGDGGSWAGAVYRGGWLTILHQGGASADLDHAKQ